VFVTEGNGNYRNLAFVVWTLAVAESCCCVIDVVIMIVLVYDITVVYEEH
jgi:hypothetical protein